MAYYDEKLAGRRLQRCYEVAQPRVRQYLQAEIDHLRRRLRPTDQVLELGCGYGRVIFELLGAAAAFVGIDSAAESIQLAGELTPPGAPCEFLAMDATALAFADDAFDVVLCVQNGVSAFRVDQVALVREARRVCRPGGRLIFSSYAAAFWDHRLRWFELQSEAGLLELIDRHATGDGVIVCQDGFRSEYVSPEGFSALWQAVGLPPQVTEVDGSVVFCEGVVGKMD